MEGGFLVKYLKLQEASAKYSLMKTIIPFLENRSL